ncbi:type II secretion system protein [Paucibacter sp. Y2R2-4]|uniref:type II secretion system protein n=1 Tax=Paucibacter sp. Y2R2-4 TaxID=2893553 RepID=UPI0021E4FE5F|nr:type II secretion system protein [Paucibacter sp. Y2R2-4]MCV2349672.1 type II secretion system GspH family protein [Paucibacter sp. Y2R2-4]
MRTGNSQSLVSRGFTYLWLLFVIALGGVALAALGQRQQTLQQREREAELRFRGEAIAQALASYARATPAGANPLPQRLEDLLEDRRSGSTRRHLRRLYADPFTGRPDWALQMGQAAAAQAPALPGAQQEGPSDVTGAGSAGLPASPLKSHFEGAVEPAVAKSAVQPHAEGQALMSGIVGVHSRARQLLLSTGVAMASLPASAPKPRVSDLRFTPVILPSSASLSGAEGAAAPPGEP